MILTFQPTGILIVKRESRHFLEGISLGCRGKLVLFASVQYFMKWISSVTGVTVPATDPDNYHFHQNRVAKKKFKPLSFNNFHENVTSIKNSNKNNTD